MVARAYGKLPLSFERNGGQAPGAVRFLARGGGYTLSLTDSGALLSLERGGHKRPALLRVGFAGASGNSRFDAVDELPGKVNYLTGSDRSDWQTNVPTYAKVRQRGLYPGIDAVFYGRGGQLEYDFVLAPRADPDQIVLRFAARASGSRPTET